MVWETLNHPEEILDMVSYSAKAKAPVKRGCELMRADASCKSRLRLTANSHQLASTRINFELSQILMQVNESFCSFDRS